MLGLRFCARAFSSYGKRGPLFIAVRGPLTVAASPVAEHRLQTRRLSICGSRAQPLRGMWDPPRPGLEPVSSALAGRSSTTAPPGKPQCTFFDDLFWVVIFKIIWKRPWYVYLTLPPTLDNQWEHSENHTPFSSLVLCLVSLDQPKNAIMEEISFFSRHNSKWSCTSNFNPGTSYSHYYI